MSEEDYVTVACDRLQPGMFVYLDLGWMEHPFPLSRFKIKSSDQINTIRGLGIREIRFSPSRSEVAPLPVSSPDAGNVERDRQVSPDVEAMLQQKRIHKQRLEHFRSRVAESQKTVSHAARQMRGIHSGIFSNPQDSLESAGKMMDDFLGIFERGNDTLLLALNDNFAGEEIYNHSVNVSVLSTLLAKELGLAPEVIKTIGLGCLFHDIGKLEIPTRVTLKTEAMTAAETSLMNEHPNFGAKIAREAGLEPGALAIVSQHHECVDGSGFPHRLKEDQISPLAQLVGIVNLYDNLCNPLDLSQALTPHEALSRMYTQYRTKLNSRMLQVFIRFMSVYPPGSLVSLSNGAIGMVICVPSDKPLRPIIKLYDPEVPKEEAILLALETVPDVNISRALRPALLSPEVYSYLSPRRRAIYFFDTGSME